MSAPSQTAAEQADLFFVPYPSIAELGLVGDRRTSATVASDGTVCWMCLPRFDASPVFGALLDLQQGGFWRMGPEDRDLGRQRYEPGTGVLHTAWEHDGCVLELTDCMAWPETERTDAEAGRHVLIRRLRCIEGSRAVTCRAVPRDDFHYPAITLPGTEGALRMQLPSTTLSLWCSAKLEPLDDLSGATLVQTMQAGEEIWAVLDNDCATAWTVEKAAAQLDATLDYWRGWSAKLDCTGKRAEEIRLSAVAVHLCTYAPTGAVIAAPTTSLPERVPGEFNYDYRYCWIRDGAIAMSLMASLGDLESPRQFLDWVAGLHKPTNDGAKGLPLQTLYRIDGALTIPAVDRPELDGYRSCRPVKFGNPVYQMREIDGFGFLVDLAAVFVAHGGTLTDAHWELVRRCADFVAAEWDKPDAGTWELMPFQNFVSSKVMCWVTLDRALSLAKGRDVTPPRGWASARSAVHADVMEKGWCDANKTFRQRYESAAMDATALLIPIFGFLEPTHERVTQTLSAVKRVLMLNGLVHRFVPERTPGRPDKLMGDKEGAFLMCNFWLAQAWQLAGEPEKAEATMARAERCRGQSGLFSEAGDSRADPGLLGNTPLLFSQAEYARAARVIG